MYERYAYSFLYFKFGLMVVRLPLGDRLKLVFVACHVCEFSNGAEQTEHFCAIDVDI
jgi:hypothetical protein